MSRPTNPPNTPQGNGPASTPAETTVISFLGGPFDGAKMVCNATLAETLVLPVNTNMLLRAQGEKAAQPEPPTSLALYRLQDANPARYRFVRSQAADKARLGEWRV